MNLKPLPSFLIGIILSNAIFAQSSNSNPDKKLTAQVWVTKDKQAAKLMEKKMIKNLH